jgi:endonuclease-8
MEGPSIVIATEEFKPFLNTRTKTGPVKGQKLVRTRSWGKHFILEFEKTMLRIHFLMFGSYRIDNPRENRTPKMVLTFPKGTVYFYSCAIKEIETLENYDWSVDTMSPKWSTPKAVRTLKKLPNEMVCDVLMNQDIFAGVGNIIKNEVQFRQRLHPETKLDQLTDKQIKALVADTRAYCLLFYKWKKANVLKRNWQIMRKRKCPLCGGPVTKKHTGKLQRISHWCRRDQPLNRSLIRSPRPGKQTKHPRSRPRESPALTAAP